jgi:tRNA(fMet)-specific endonuclease VapC
LVVTVALDTNVIVELIRGKQPRIRERFGDLVLSEQRLVTSLIVLHELLYGCERHPQSDEERIRTRVVLNDIQIEPLDESDVGVAVRLRSKLAQVGRPIGAYDLLIAGQALARGWTLVTANTREFNRVEGLDVIDWTLAAD